MIYSWGFWFYVLQVKNSRRRYFFDFYRGRSSVVCYHPVTITLNYGFTKVVHDLSFLKKICLWINLILKILQSRVLRLMFRLKESIGFWMKMHPSLVEGTRVIKHYALRLLINRLLSFSFLP